VKILNTHGRLILELPGDLNGADLRGRSLPSASLDGQILVETDFSEAHLVSARLDDVNARHARFTRANMEGVTCMDACFDEADFSDADLYWCIAFGASFRGAKLVGASLRGADLKSADFFQADLSGADLGLDNVGGATQLQGANLIGAKLVGTQLAGAQYDQLTRFPEGFDPKRAGMAPAQTA
jgi:uncharacterized protein YjbI with pentapeptide repeats